MKLAIIGGGASGLMAGYAAGKNGASVTIFDGNEKPGKKLYITGKGRCNVTNEATGDEFLANVVTNPKFLYSAIKTFSSADTLVFFNSFGVPLKLERGGRYFPVSDESSDVIKALVDANSGTKFKYNCAVKRIYKAQGRFIIEWANGKEEFDKVIIATGGKSYQATGSTGDGYEFAKSFGHNIIEPKSALVPIKIKEDFIKYLEGLSLKNIKLIANINGKMFKELFGELLFTSNSISGPISLSMSSYLNKQDLSTLKLYIDFKPALSKETLDSRLVREFDNFKNKEIKNLFYELLPRRFVPVFLKRAGIDECTKVNSLKKSDRQNIINLLKCFELKFDRLMMIECGIITSGGVDTKQISSSSMESKLQSGLYFAGEVIDVDCLTGGYNIQTALSTGYLAGISAAKNI